MRATPRPLPTIEAELRVALKRETFDIIAIGDLLTEAKRQVGHGRWLPWLTRQFLAVGAERSQLHAGEPVRGEASQIGNGCRFGAEPERPLRPQRRGTSRRKR